MVIHTQKKKCYYRKKKLTEKAPGLISLITLHGFPRTDLIVRNVLNHRPDGERRLEMECHGKIA